MRLPDHEMATAYEYAADTLLLRKFDAPPSFPWRAEWRYVFDVIVPSLQATARMFRNQPPEGFVPPKKSPPKKRRTKRRKP